VNLIANTGLSLMLFVSLIILRTDMKIDLILIDLLQRDRIFRVSNDHLFVFQDIFVCVSISTGDFEEIQILFDRLMLNCPRLAKYECSSLVCTKKFINEDDITVECVSHFLTDHLDSEVFSFADSLLDFVFDGGEFKDIILIVQQFYYLDIRLLISID
jgi:hypothetical protein